MEQNQAMRKITGTTAFLERHGKILLTFWTVLLLSALMGEASAQTYTVIHAFTGGPDGASPEAGLVMDRAGNLYGTTWSGGESDYGVVFKMTQTNAGWVLAPLYTFSGGNDGAFPTASVVLGLGGRVYGTTSMGGTGACPGGQGCGTVFSLRPASTACGALPCSWSETVLYRFSGGADGGFPYAKVTFDPGGNLYGTTSTGGSTSCVPPFGCGTVYELSPSGQSWIETTIYTFLGGSDGGNPSAGVTLGSDGNLYGTTKGAIPFGNVYQLVPSGGTWSENTLYSFQGGDDGGDPYAGVVFDASGRLFGATSSGGANGGGTVFDLTQADGSWQFNLDYSLSGTYGPRGDLVFDANGNLYGTTVFDGANGFGSVFKLVPSGQGWTYVPLHDFTGGSDGSYPYGKVLIDAMGNIYGTASGGGSCCGVVFEITP